jgi:hypothetical protein
MCDNVFWGVGKGIQRTWLAEAEKARFWKRLKERRAANIFDILSQTWMEKRRREGEEGEKRREEDWVSVRDSPQLLPPSRCPGPFFHGFSALVIFVLAVFSFYCMCRCYLIY